MDKVLGPLVAEYSTWLIDCEQAVWHENEHSA